MLLCHAGKQGTKIHVMNPTRHSPMTFKNNQKVLTEGIKSTFSLSWTDPSPPKKILPAKQRGLDVQKRSWSAATSRSDTRGTFLFPFHEEVDLY